MKFSLYCITVVLIIMCGIMYAYFYLYNSKYKVWATSVGPYGLSGYEFTYWKEDNCVGRVDYQERIDKNKVKDALILTIKDVRDKYLLFYVKNSIRIPDNKHNPVNWDYETTNCSGRPSWIVVAIDVMDGSEINHTGYLYHASQIFNPYIDYGKINDEYIYYSKDIYTKIDNSKDNEVTVLKQFYYSRSHNYYKDENNSDIR